MDNTTAAIIEETFYQEFRRSRWARFLGWFTSRNYDLCAFDQYIKDQHITGRHDVGVQTLHINQITGSVGRTEDFDSAFRPRRPYVHDRWISIKRASEEGVIMPPVTLYKVGESYFVVDGHHRLSVARADRQDYVDAYVTEFHVARSFA